LRADFEEARFVGARSMQDRSLQDSFGR